MKKIIAALAAVTLVLGMSITSIPAFADNAPAAKADSADQKADAGKAKAHKGGKKGKKASGGSTTPPPK
jgi:hypothetical protein